MNINSFTHPDQYRSGSSSSDESDGATSGARHASATNRQYSQLSMPVRAEPTTPMMLQHLRMDANSFTHPGQYRSDSSSSNEDDRVTSQPTIPTMPQHQGMQSRTRLQQYEVAHLNDAPPIASNDYCGHIDALVLGSARRSPGTIAERVELARSFTTQNRSNPYALETNAFPHGSDGRREFQFTSQYKPQTDTFVIDGSWRTNFPQLNASDAYLAQLSKVIPDDSDNLPSRLPKKIRRDAIFNTIAENAINRICNEYRVGHNASVTLSLDRDNPSSRENQLIHELLVNTRNGQSTAHLVGDFNQAKGTTYTIDSVSVSKSPCYALEFTVSSTR